MIRLKELRNESNLTQKELGKKLDLDGHNIGDWERGKGEPSIEWLTKLANFFNVSIDYLVGREDDFGNINIPGQSTDREYANINDEEKELLKAFRACSEQTKKNIMLLAKNMQSLENRSKNIY